MKAIVQDTYGSPDVLQLKDIDKPRVGADDVLIRVHAAGVDPGVWHLMTGLPYLWCVSLSGCADRGTPFAASTSRASSKRSARR